MIKSATPLLHVSNSAAAQAFYCDQMGFKLEFAHRSDRIWLIRVTWDSRATGCGLLSRLFPVTG